MADITSLKILRKETSFSVCNQHIIVENMIDECAKLLSRFLYIFFILGEGEIYHALTSLWQGDKVIDEKSMVLE